jgi:hypothetical protein
VIRTLAPRRIPPPDRNKDAGARIDGTETARQRPRLTELLFDEVVASLVRTARRWGIDPDPEHVEIAGRLVAAGQHARAMRIVCCPPLGSWIGRPCRQRCCGTCMRRRAAALAETMAATIATYRSPLSLLITCPSASLLDLPIALARLHEGLGTMRRRISWRRGCIAGVIAIEAPPTRDGRRWALHGHGAVDLAALEPEAASAWIAEHAAQWPQLVGTPGAVLDFEPLRSGRDLARYSFKIGESPSWAPSPDELSSHLLAHLDRALRGRRMLISWGRQRSR